MRTPVLVIVGALALAACAPVTDAPTPAAEVAGEPGPQRCDLETGRALIGSHVGAVSFPADANVRIVCTTCPTTKDLRPDRLNIRFDQATGIIRSVECG